MALLDPFLDYCIFGIWVLKAEYHVNMDYHSNYNKLLMEKRNLCSALVRLCKNILIVPDVVSKSG